MCLATIGASIAASMVAPAAVGTAAAFIPGTFAVGTVLGGAATGGLAAAAAPSAGLFAGITGGQLLKFGLSSGMQLMKGKMTGDILQAQADVAQYQADREGQAFALREVERQRNRKKFIASQRARAGASGFMTSNFGDLFSETASEFAKESFTDKFSSEGKQTALRSNAKIKKTKGRNAIVKSVVGVGVDAVKRFS